MELVPDEQDPQRRDDMAVLVDCIRQELLALLHDLQRPEDVALLPAALERLGVYVELWQRMRRQHGEG
jgi:hypothetical protein